MPSILFMHTNFPAQFGFLGEKLIEAGWQVAFATRRQEAAHPRIRVIRFAEGRETTPKLHPYLVGTEKAVITGQNAARALIEARKAGLSPDVVMCHSGWGAGLFARDLFPDALFVPYAEWWYRYPPVDSVATGEFEPSLDVQLRQRIRNAPMLLDLEGCDFALCPTRFQAAQFPAHLRAILRVIHDGVDTATHAPAAERPKAVAETDLTGMAEIVTYATRGMEPQRGFPQFMRALERLQKARPRLHALIVGTDRVAYGKQLPEGDSWKKRMLEECDLDPDRTHFLGHLSRRNYLTVLQASDAHVYLTAPFVLSWSMLEAMSTGCAIVGSDTEPVREFMRHEETGLLVPFQDHEALADGIARLLDDRELARRLGRQARRAIRRDYDLATVFAQKKTMLDQALAARR